MRRVNPGRLAALRALVEVEEGAHAEDVVAAAPVDDPGQRALALHLVLGVLRRRGALDDALARFSKRSIADLDPVVRAALRVGLFDALFSKVGAFAAVDQAVEATRALEQPRAAGFVNAVLRRAVPAGISDDPWLDLPPWLRTRWSGWDAWVRRLREPAPLSGVARDPGWTPPAELQPEPATAGGVPVPGAFVARGARGPVEKLPGFAEGQWWVMDPAAAAVADLVLDAVGEGRGARILDACAAPGGKSLWLAAAGCEVLAADLSPARLERVRENVARTGLVVQCQPHDWLKGPLEGAGLFDAVLVDAPCTGLGIVRKHPEIRWMRLPTDPAAMALRQVPLALAAASHVRPGGALVYAVCSPMPEEGEGVVSRLEGWKVERAWSTVPPAGDEDAFQAFVLRRS